MYKRAQLFLAIIVTCWSPTTFGGSTQDALRDIRIAYEVTHLDFAEVDAAVAKNWAVLRVTEGPHDEADASQIAQLPQPEPGPQDFPEFVPGTATLVHALRGTARAGSWPCYVPVPKRLLFTSPMIYMEYGSPGLCICRLNEHAKASRSVVEEAYLIPDDWLDHVKLALEFWRVNREMFAIHADQPRRSKLIELVKSDNPVLAYLACRTLGQSGGLSPRDVPDGMLANPHTQGVLIDFLLLRYPAGDKGDAAFKNFSQRIDTAHSPEELHAIASACALDLETDRDPFNPAPVTKRPYYLLLTQIETRGAAMSKDGKPDDYLDGALKGMRGIRHLREVVKKFHDAQTRPVR